MENAQGIIIIFLFNDNNNNNVNNQKKKNSLHAFWLIDPLHIFSRCSLLVTLVTHYDFES